MLLSDQHTAGPADLAEAAHAAGVVGTNACWQR
jgi:hypothetical protein